MNLKRLTEIRDWYKSDWGEEGGVREPRIAEVVEAVEIAIRLTILAKSQMHSDASQYPACIQGMVPAYLVERIGKNGKVVDVQISSEFPMTTMQIEEYQRCAAKVFDVDFAHAQVRLIWMVADFDAELAARLAR